MTMIQVAGVLLIQNGKYVVQKRDNIPTIADPGMLSLWGGAVEGDETPLQGVKRELEEETGVVLPEASFVFLDKYITKGRSPKRLGEDVEVFIYFAELGKDVEVRCLEGEAAVHLSSIEEADTPVTDFIENAVRAYEQRTATA